MSFIALLQYLEEESAFNVLDFEILPQGTC